MAISDLFKSELKVINIGLSDFKQTLDRTQVSAIHVDWKPPADVAPASFSIIERHSNRIESANRMAMERIFSAQPLLTGLDLARNVIPGMTEDTILHAGPPVTWDRMCGPMRGAVIGALMYEQRASDELSARDLAASGKIHFSPCHEHGAAGPMAGIVSPSMPVFIVENKARGNRTYSTMNEGLGKVLRYGAYDTTVLTRLKWMETTLFPCLRNALAQSGPVDLRMMIAQALHMGDEVHNRNRAATSLLYRTLAPSIVLTASDPGAASEVLEFINRNDHFFLNLSMAASKCALDTAHSIPYSSIVITMARNGTDFGVRLSGTGDLWFTGPADVPDALYFAGYSKADANPDIGDSAITETAGLGGFAIAASPAIVQFVGGSVSDALATTMKMYEITSGEHPVFQIPALNFRGSPSGIDVIKVIENNILPFIDTGVAHKDPGVGQIGAGVLSAPMLPFKKAFNEYINTLATLKEEES